MKITAVIMAGGRGERFWPKSRNNCPKQFLSLTSDGETMIQKTVKRLSPMVAPEDVFIVTNAAYTDLVKDQLPDVPAENILAEPCARNTAPCIAFAAAVIGRKYDDAIMLVLPSDHLIGYEDIYVSTLKKAVKVAEQGKNLVTIGITPTYPETGYGYINFGKEAGSAYEVERFVEKPDLATAKKYLASGKYLWNSGMFVWKISSVMANLKEFMPDIYEGALRIGESFGTQSYTETLVKEFSAFTSESIDFGIMEKADDIYTLPGSFGWDDVGSWLAVERINETDDDKNYVDGDVITVDSKRTTICGGKRLVAAIGTRDIIIVDTDDVLLVCSKNNTQDVKKVIAQLKEQGRNELV
ncbi:MAG: mannose-1-phosphate guanylyltransferase [Ruminococcus sp.]|jgi:mannose-1-phosphate guanylyltransferase|nr:mannose-1-phosphate guanylyltransferase [Ruminococcus sp.]MBQ1339981.1 mannose-1-phosphate guanylyltransferase [Ruminococcus sp.]